MGIKMRKKVGKSEVKVGNPKLQFGHVMMGILITDFVLIFAVKLFIHNIQNTIIFVRERIALRAYRTRRGVIISRYVLCTRLRPPHSSGWLPGRQYSTRAL